MISPGRRGLFLLRILIAVALTVVAAPVWGGEMGVTCGRPEKGGWVRMWIKITRPEGTVTETAYIEMELSGPSWTAEQKAEFFRLSVPEGFENKFEFAGAGAQVIATGKNGWRVAGIGIDNDETNEPDATLSYVTPTDELALCSLSGVASGRTATGTPGRFTLAVAGRMALLPTSPGMPAQLIEQQVFSQLMAQGVNIRFATAADLALVSEVPNDGRVLAIEGLDASGLSQQLQDTGLIIDIAGVVSPPLPPADPAATIPGTEADGTFLALGTGSIPALPADFFGPGSDPFEGTVCLVGMPFDEMLLGDASTVIQRSRSPFDLLDPPGSEAVVPIELVALSLVSCEPITVTYNGGHVPEPWQVSVDLSRFLPSVGEMHATKTHSNGGTFTSSFYVQPRFTFVRLGDLRQVVLDEGMPPLIFVATDGHWVHSLSPHLQIITFSDGNFVPGVWEENPGDLLSQQLRRLHAHEASGAARHTIFPAQHLSTSVPSVSGDEFWARSYPNPGNRSTRIVYAMPRRGALSIAIYNVRGERVRTLIEEVVDPGAISVTWDGRDDHGAQTGSDIYFCRIAALGRVTTTKIALLK